MEEYYADVKSTFMDVFATVRGKMAQGLPMTTPKEKEMFEFIKQWCESFGYRSL